MGSIKEQRVELKDKRLVLIRTVKESDAQTYLELGKSIMSENIYSLTKAEELTITLEQERDWIISSLENPNHLIVVAELEGKIIGQLNFSNGHKERIAHNGEFGMGVHKNFRGMGIGRLLLEKLIEWCRENETIEKINLCVHQTNDRAIKLYQDLGFKKEGVRMKDLKYSDGTYVNTVFMGLFL